MTHGWNRWTPTRRSSFAISPNDFAFTHTDAHAPNGDLTQWNLIREGGPRAWDLSRGKGSEVAMIDSGVDGSHPDIASHIAGAAAFGTSSPTTDSVGHGTHTAGLACGDSDNGFGIASMGFDCSLFIAKIALPGLVLKRRATRSRRPANRSSDVISMSLGGCDSGLGLGAQLRPVARVGPGCGRWTTPRTRPDRCGPFTERLHLSRGVAAAARHRARTPASTVAWSSPRPSTTGRPRNGVCREDDPRLGRRLRIGLGPGRGTAGHPLELARQQRRPRIPPGGRTTVNGDNRFSYLVGTSMATPQVAGVAALIRAVKPNIANTKVVHLIKATASHCGSYGDGIGWGVIRADQAVAAALDRDIDPPSSRVKRAPASRTASVDLKIKRHDTSGEHRAA